MTGNDCHDMCVWIARLWQPGLNTCTQNGSGSHGSGKWMAAWHLERPSSEDQTMFCYPTFHDSRDWNGVDFES